MASDHRTLISRNPAAVLPGQPMPEPARPPAQGAPAVAGAQPAAPVTETPTETALAAPPPPLSLGRFFAVALAWMLALTVAWTFVAPWTSRPVAVLTHMALEAMAPDWIDKVRHEPGRIEVETRVGVVSAPQPGARPVLADLVVEAIPQRYAYSLPILLALLLTVRSRGWVWRAVAGAALLLPLQAFSLVFAVLRDVVVNAHNGAAGLGVAQWQVEAIVLGYQFGALVMPTLSPIMLWLWLDRAFFSRTLAVAFAPKPPRG